MKQMGLSYFSDIQFTVLGLLIFLLFFIGVLLWTFRKGTRKHYSAMSKLPLKGDDNNE